MIHHCVHCGWLFFESLDDFDEFDTDFDFEEFICDECFWFYLEPFTFATPDKPELVFNDVDVEYFLHNLVSLWS